MFKNFLFIGSGLIFGVVLAVPSVILFLRTDSGQALLLPYITTAPPQWPDVTTLVQQSSESAGFSIAQVLTQPIGIAVPKAYATDNYSFALNEIVANMQQLATSSNALGPILIELNNRSLSGNFSGFFDLIVKAKQLVAEEHALSDRLAQNVTALSAANQDTADAVTKSLTLSMINTVDPVQRDLAAYLSAMDMLLSGSVPSPAVIRSVGTAANTLTADVTVFGESFKQLTAHLSAEKKSAQ